MLVQLTVHLKVSGRGITLYTSVNEASPRPGACQCQLCYYYCKFKTYGNRLTLHTRDLEQTSAQRANKSRGIPFTMSTFLHSRGVRKEKNNATSKLAAAIVVSLVIVLVLISVALWLLGRMHTKHRAQQVVETRDKRPGVENL
jgi:hypothetical protein